MAVFNIITPSQQPSRRRDPIPDEEDAMEDILMEDDEGNEAGPSRAKAVGGGRVTGPGEVIADAGKFMRFVVSSMVGLRLKN